MTATPSWEPPSVISRSEVLKLHHEVTALANIPLRIREDIFRIHALEMDWDIGVVIYEPEDPAKIPRGPDGAKVGVFLLHGGVSDYKSLDTIARLLAEKFGVKVASMTFRVGSICWTLAEIGRATWKTLTVLRARRSG